MLQSVKALLTRVQRVNEDGKKFIILQFIMTSDLIFHAI